jgi:hypothetical protein
MRRRIALSSTHSAIYRGGALDKGDLYESVKQKECQIINGLDKMPDGVVERFRRRWKRRQPEGALKRGTRGNIGTRGRIDRELVRFSAISVISACSAFNLAAPSSLPAHRT